MGKPFKGVVNIDIRDSTPDWEPYEQPKAPEGAPKCSSSSGTTPASARLEPFGGPIEVPTCDYPGEPPWAFAGGTIKPSVVDVSGEHYLDLEKEAMAVLSRE